MTSTRWYGRDTQLTLRIGATLFLLAALYAVFLVVLWNLCGSAILLVAAGVGLLLIQFYASDVLVLRTTHARLLNDDEEPELRRIVLRLAQMANVGVPRLAVIETRVPNAFAVGRSPKRAVIAVSRGLLQTLEPAELEAVLAHELSHILNRDMMVMTYASLLASVAAFMVHWGRWLRFGGRGGSRNPLAVVFLISLAVWLISFFLLRALSRYREYAADRGAVILTGTPANMRSALIKVNDVIQHIPTRDLRTAQPLHAFYIVSQSKRSRMGELFGTHPSIEHRLARLEAMQRSLEARPR